MYIRYSWCYVACKYSAPTNSSCAFPSHIHKRKNSREAVFSFGGVICFPEATAKRRFSSDSPACAAGGGWSKRANTAAVEICRWACKAEQISGTATSSDAPQPQRHKSLGITAFEKVRKDPDFFDRMTSLLERTRRFSVIFSYSRWYCFAAIFVWRRMVLTFGQLRGEYNITADEIRNITFTKWKYHFVRQHRILLLIYRHYGTSLEFQISLCYNLLCDLCYKIRR